jgi:hypothetical protein
MRFIIDGAGYHRKTNPKYQLATKNKPELSGLLLELGKKTITVTREGQPVVMDSNTWLKTKSGKAPGKDELLSALKEMLAKPANAHLLDSELIKLFKAESLTDSKNKDSMFHQVIFTPPYEFNTQPSEMCWAYCKNFVARTFCKSRGLKPLREHTRQGFYGDGDKHKPYNAELARKHIAKSTKYVSDWAAEDEVLKGIGKVGHFNEEQIKEFKKERDAEALENHQPDEIVDMGVCDDTMFGPGDRLVDDQDVGKDTELYCVCRKEYNENETMLCCDGCDDWFHLKCVDLKATDKAVTDKKAQWKCPTCQPDKKAKKLKKSRKG